MRALTPELVPHDLLPGALALRGVAGQIGVITGPALGGIIFADRARRRLCHRRRPADVVRRRRGDPRHAAGRAPRVTTEPPGWDSLVAGVRFIFRTRILLAAIALDLFACCSGDSIVLAPVFANSILHTGPVGLGALRTAPSVGALIAAVLLARRPLQIPAGRTLLGVIVVFGGGMVVFGLSKCFRCRLPPSPSQDSST